MKLFDRIFLHGHQPGRFLSSLWSFRQNFKNFKYMLVYSRDLQALNWAPIQSTNRPRNDNSTFFFSFKNTLMFLKQTISVLGDRIHFLICEKLNSLFRNKNWGNVVILEGFGKRLAFAQNLAKVKILFY